MGRSQRHMQEIYGRDSNGFTDASPSNLRPRNTVAPAITGTAQVGETLTTTNGTWVGPIDGKTITFTRQWYRGATAISGATGLTRVLAEADLAAIMTCRVTATNLNGTTVAVSNATEAVIAA
jgi:hypothetical protein